MGYSGPAAPGPALTCLPADWWDPAWQAVKSPGAPAPGPAVPGGVDQAIASADAFFGTELPAIGAWSFGPAEAETIDIPVLSVLGTTSNPFFFESRSVLREWRSSVDDFDLVGANHQMQVMDAAGVADALIDFFGKHPL